MARFNSNKKEVENSMDKAEIKALKLVGAMIQSEASQIARDKGVFDTGLLVQSMGHEIYDTDKKFVRVGNTVHYAIYQEMGTSKQVARPFLEPSVMENKQDIQDLIKDVFKEEMG